MVVFKVLIQVTFMLLYIPTVANPALNGAVAILFDISQVASKSSFQQFNYPPVNFDNISI